METEINDLRHAITQLVNSPYISFADVKKQKNIMGVYMIYDQFDSLMYIGSTNKFNVRFGTDLRHESTHTLMKKLITLQVHLDRATAQDHFSNHYKYKVHICYNKREAEALEHLAIWILNPKYNK
ncbi:hypothetical protein GCM10011387_32390 [Pedobacter quisquiliarum]|jgi:predicted GIY-YIG superfamily endonuclease|uniref:GIY-YIG domain-containing protein n=1 Tax=Pedobacter quisquiliarum TaxID=1834438 RepID=A0A916UKK4_9SPHI|nr:GIY-YIG nuclease family protein [Pedobacter quisquiliarum]GGC76107.1 hypothetical protein GCM10011387_32390 [Pedobacter quisquiliarum]